jgi:hypothetical protein
MNVRHEYGTACGWAYSATPWASCVLLVILGEKQHVVFSEPAAVAVCMCMCVLELCCGHGAPKWYS